MTTKQGNMGAGDGYEVEAALKADHAFAGLDPIFARDKFLLKQKVLTINQKYNVSDEAGNQLLFVQRPAFVIRNILAMLAAILAFFVGIGATIALGAAIVPKDAVGIFAILGLLVGIGGAIAAALVLSPKRHVTFFRDENMADPLLYVLQDKKFAIMNFTYSIMDTDGNLVAVLRKNYLYDFFRKKWVCEDANGQPVCIIREDSAIKAFFRRFIGGIIAAMLKTDFIITDASGTLLGKFNRKFTLLDRYVLDMTPDAARRIDRRVALAIGVMLDTGERR